MESKKSIKVPNELVYKYNEVAELIIGFFDTELNEEYKEMCLQLCAAMCRKRPSPIVPKNSFLKLITILSWTGKPASIVLCRSPILMKTRSPDLI